MANVTFDGTNKIISVNTGITELNVRQDLYSAWKDWLALDDNLKFPMAFRAVGGDTISSGKYVGDYYFITNGWKVRPYEGNHTLFVYGNLYVDGGGNPFIPTLGNYNVLISMQNSSLTEKVSSGSAVTQEDIDSISSAVWSKSINSLQPSSLGEAVEIIKKLVNNKVSKSGNIITIFENDGTTIWKQYDLANGGRLEI